jgi:hypothetical protein
MEVSQTTQVLEAAVSIGLRRQPRERIVAML